MAKDIRVRYAPSPTGLLHIGNARTALFNYLYARHHGGTFIIRIEDTDRKRHVEDGERSQLENLRWLGMDWDESPETHENYRQSERLELYQKYIDQLLAEGKAYKSYVTEEELAAERERQEAAGETPRYINEYLGMSEEEKAAYDVLKDWIREIACNGGNARFYGEITISGYIENPKSSTVLGKIWDALKTD